MKSVFLPLWNYNDESSGFELFGTDRAISSKPRLDVTTFVVRLPDYEVGNFDAGNQNNGD